MRPKITEQDCIDDPREMADECKDLPLVICGLNPEITLNCGVRRGDGSWLVSGAALADLQLSVARQVAPTVAESAPVVDLDALQRDLGSEQIELEGMPPNAQFSTGVDLGDGRWRLNPLALKGLKLSLANAQPDEFRIAAKPTYHAERHEVELNMRLECAPVLEQSVRSLIVSDLPEGARLLGGTPLAEEGAWAISRSDLGFLSILPPRHRHGAFSLTVGAHYTDASGSPRRFKQRLAFCVAAQPRAPRVEAHDSHGVAGQACPLRLFVDAPQPAAAYVVSIVVHGVPSVARLSRGVATGDGSWWLTPADLPDLTLVGPSAHASTVAMSIEALSVEIATGARAATAPLPFTLSLEASYADAAGPKQQNPVSLGTDSARVIVCAVPNGAELSHGQALGDGCWSVAREDAAEVALRDPGQGRIDALPSVCIPSQHADDPSQFAVEVVPLRTSATFAATRLVVMALDLKTLLRDTLGSKTLSVTISGVPIGCALSQGTHQGNGVWVLPGASAPVVCLQAPHAEANEWRLQIDAVGAPGGTDTSATVCLRSRGFNAVSDGPESPTGTETVSIFDAEPLEDAPAPSTQTPSLMHS